MTIAYQAFTVAFSGKYLFNHNGENGISYNPFWISKTYTTVKWYYIPFDGLIFNTVCYFIHFTINVETIYPHYKSLLISWVTNYLVNPIKNHSSKQLTSIPDVFHDRVSKYFTRESHTEKMRHTCCQKWDTRELTGILIHVSRSKLN